MFNQQKSTINYFSCLAISGQVRHGGQCLGPIHFEVRNGASATSPVPAGRFPEAPVGMVITHLASEHADFVPAAERTEQARHLVRDHFLGFRRFALPTGHWKSQAGTACPICQCVGNHSLFN